MMQRGQGHNVFLKDEDLKLIQKGICGTNLCPNCGYPLVILNGLILFTVFIDKRAGL